LTTPGPQAKKQQSKVRINQHITARTVRLVDPEGFTDGVIGVMSSYDALRKAESLGKDLVEISPNAEPPVVRIMDFGKFLFDEKKNKKKQKIQKIKEIKLRPVTDEGDFQVKLRNLIGFLDGGDKVKVTLRFRGREIAHHELGLAQLKRLQAAVLDHGVVESLPKLEGKQLVMMIGPVKK